MKHHTISLLDDVTSFNRRLAAWSVRVCLPLALVFLCARCAGTHASRSLTGESSVAGAREGYVDAGGGVRLFYRFVGRGSDTVVVLHGGPGFSMSYLEPDLEPLAARHVLLYYDQRGAGRSTLVSDSAGLDAEHFVDDLEAVRTRFGLRRLTLLGHSWGAGVAALYVARHPDRVGRLLVVDGIPLTGAERAQGLASLDSRRDSTTQRRVRELRAALLANPGDAAACRAFYAVWFAAAFADSTALRRSRGDFCAGGPEALRNKSASVDRFTIQSLGNWDWRAAMHAFTAPALVIHGALDHFPPESAREWVAAMPNGRLLLLDGAGHFSYLDKPAPFFAAADAFLAGGWPAGAVSVAAPARGAH